MLGLLLAHGIAFDFVVVVIADGENYLTNPFLGFVLRTEQAP